MRHDDIKKEIFSKRPKVEEEYNKTKWSFEIAKFIIEARIEKNMTQKELAEKIDTKQPAIARIESGVYIPSIKTLLKIADALGKDLMLPRFKKEFNCDLRWFMDSSSNNKFFSPNRRSMIKTSIDQNKSNISSQTLISS